MVWRAIHQYPALDVAVSPSPEGLGGAFQQGRLTPYCCRRGVRNNPQNSTERLLGKVGLNLPVLGVRK